MTDMKPNWIRFLPGNPLPPERRYVLLQLAGDERSDARPSVAVGWLKFAAGDLTCPFFVVPNGPSRADGRLCHITHWADCLGDDWYCPLWRGPQEKGVDRGVLVSEEAWESQQMMADIEEY